MMARQPHGTDEGNVGASRRRAHGPADEQCDNPAHRKGRHHPSCAELFLLVEDAEWVPSHEDDAPEVPARSVDIVAFRGGWASDGTPVAVASVGTTTLRARRIHRSFIIEIDRGEPSRNSTVFCPANPDVTLPVEVASQRLAASLGMAAGSVIVVLGSIEEPPSRQATRARLVKRRVESDWTTATKRPGGRFPDRDHASVLPIEEDDGKEATEILDGTFADSVHRLLTAVLPVPTARRVARRHRVIETWEGDGRAEVTTTIEGHEPAFGTAGLTVDLGVDRNGHVVFGSTGWTCPVCGTTGCWECSTDELLATCLSCGQEACGTCRSEDHSSLGESPPCSYCGTRSCGGCGRRAGVSACSVCGVDACAQCRDGALCNRCGHLEVASDEDVDRLPNELHARGLTVALGWHRDDVVVAMRGAERSEIAVVRRGEVEKWWTVSECDVPGGWLGEAYRSSGDGNCVIEWEPVDHSVPSRAGHAFLVVDRHDRAVVTWRCTDSAGTLVSASVEPIAIDRLWDEPAVHEAIDDAAGDEHRRPVRPHRRLAGVLSSLVPDDIPPVRHVMSVARHRTMAQTEIHAGGIRSFSCESGQMVSVVAPWHGPTVGDRNLFAGWFPTPTVLAAASVDGVVAALATFGPLVVLAVERRSEPLRYLPLTDVAGVLESIELGESLNSGSGPVVVTSVADPRAAGEVSVVDGELTASDVGPMILGPDGPPSRAATSQAVRYWPAARPPTMAPVEAVPPDDIADALFATAQSFGHIPEPSVVSLGVEVTETWDTASGPLTLARRVRPEPYVSALTAGSRVDIDVSGARELRPADEPAP